MGLGSVIPLIKTWRFDIWFGVWNLQAKSNIKNSLNALKISISNTAIIR